jgi:asparagine synthase (glutamine-hydrolysing)
VGAFLSGGLDSSTIVALMTRHATGAVKTFSVGFGDLINELPYARQVAEAYRTEHRELQMDIAVGELAARMAEVYDEPFADSSNIPTYLMSQFAARHVKVALVGDGGDELFGGYDWYAPLLSRPADPLSSPSAATDPSLDLWDRHLAHATALHKTQAARDALWGGAAPTTVEALRRAYRPADSVRDMDRATDFDVRCYLPGDILVKVDRAAMAHGLETRAPFLDADLVEYVLSLPWQLRFKGNGAGGLKPLLREVCGDLWPAALRDRPKQGFGAPVRNWVTRPDVRDLLRRACGPAGPLAALLPGAPVAVEAVAAGKPVARWGEAQLVWTLLCLGLWLGTRSWCL